MAIVRWNPARDLMQMREEMDRLFSQFLRRGEGEEATWGQGMWAPPVDIYETENAFMLKAEFPGFSKDDVQIEVQENCLIIRGERKREEEVKEEKYHLAPSLLWPPIRSSWTKTPSWVLSTRSSASGQPPPS